MKNPNFFIIGAPKCGTTSLATWLSEHPQVYMSPVKEPHHYSTDFKYDDYSDRESYLSLFDGAGDKHLAVGEASVWYLFSENAVPAIEDEYDNARYIVMLRNPVEMAPSLHRQMLFSGDENIKSFMEVWKAQKERSAGQRIPLICHEPKFLLYGKACCLGAQLKRLYDTVERDRVLPILLDDIKEDPSGVWLKVLSFLGVDDDGRTEFPVKNKAKKRRVQSIVYLYAIYAKLLKKMNIKPLGFGIQRQIERLIVTRPCDKLPEYMREELVSFFRNDLQLLSRLLERDLEDKWLN